MSDLLSDQFARLLADLPQDRQAAERVLNESGFLDVLVPEGDGGAGLSLEDVFPLGLSVGRSPTEAPVLEMMLARAMACTAEDLPRATGAASAAVLMAGAMEALVAMTLEYAGTRRQFGREIGKFQAVQHQLALMAEETMAARTAAAMAFTGRLADLDANRAAVAKIRAGEAAQIVAAGAHAIHGAIGISEELPLHRYTARLRRYRMAYGAESWWAERLGRAVLAARTDTVGFVRTLCAPTVDLVQ